ncbi:MAG: mechanosensitive ion channel domain-containing protein [Verrucomicrobiota bacterium]
MGTNTVAGVEIPAEVVQSVESMIIGYSLSIIGALAVLMVGFWLVKQARKIIAKLMERHEVDPTLISFTTAMAHIALKVFVILAALEVLDIKTTSLVAMLGAAGLAVGLALQGSLSNFAAGVLMIIFKPFSLNDVVTVSGEAGTVKEIGILTTMIDTFDNKRVIIPNSKVLADNITNHTFNNTRRVDLVAGISYSDDIDKARAAIKEAIAGIPEVLAEPAPDILVSEMADSSVNFAVRPWCKPIDYWKVYFGVTEAIKKKFDAEGISIPFPQRDVHLYEHKDG